jgi:hypothetical protein
VPVEILGVVDAIFDLVAVAVELPEFRAIAFHVPVDVNLDDLVGREEAVADPLPQRIGEDRLAEIVDVGNIFGFLRRGGEADLRRAGKMGEDFPPCRILGRTAAMAFIDHDQVEESGRKLAIELLSLLRPGDGLIEPEIDLEGGADPPLLVERQRQVFLGAVLPLDGLGVGGELRHCRAERAEIVQHRLVDQHVAVGEEQDALLAGRLPQAPDDLKRGVGLARAGRHDQQHAVAALSDGLDRGVDCIHLIVTRRLAAAVVEIVLKHDLLSVGVETLPGAIARPQVGRRREGVEAKVRFDRNAPAGAVVEHEAVAVRGKHEGNIQRRGIVEALLHAVANAVIIVLRLDQRDRDIRPVVKYEVGLLRVAARHQLPAHDDPALGEIDLLPNLHNFVPPGALDGRQDEFRADIAFGEAPFIHRAGRILQSFNSKRQYWHGCERFASGANRRSQGFQQVRLAAAGERPPFCLPQTRRAGNNLTGPPSSEKDAHGLFVALRLFDEALHAP